MLENTGSTKRPIVDGWIIFYFLLAAVGLYGMVHVFLYGQEASYGLSRDIEWGLLIIGYSFFVGITTGLSMWSAASHVFGFKSFHTMSRKMMWLALSALLSGFFIIFWDLGGPFRLQILRFVVNIVPFHWTSPIWWMSVLYALELPLIVIEVVLLLLNKEKYTFIASLVGFLVGISAYSNMGFVFSANISRPFWHGPFIPLFFILSALGLGAAFVLILLFIYSNKMDKEKFVFANGIYSKTLFVVLLAVLFAIIWRSVTILYGNELLLYPAAKQLLAGSLAFNFWFFEIFIGIVLPLIILLASKFKSPTASFIASIMVIIGVFFMRYDTVIAGQLVAVISPYFSQAKIASYIPSLSEVSLFISAWGVMGFFYSLGVRILRLEEVEE